MKTPTSLEVENAKDNQLQLAIWYRFCECESDEDIAVINLICKYFKGFTPSLSKEVGWNE